MPYFYSAQPLIPESEVVIAGEEAGHLLGARRTRPGDRVTLQDADGRRALAEVTTVERRRAVLRVVEPLPVPPLPPVRMTLLQAAVKEKAAEWIVQKATEIGVAEIGFYPAANSTIAPAQLAAPRVAVRWERIAREACKQCDRGHPPSITIHGGLTEALAATAEASRGWLLSPGAAPPRWSGGAPATARLVVGPEGGLTEAEEAVCREAGLTPVGLGGHLMRAETAALAGCALLLFGASQR